MATHSRVHVFGATGYGTTTLGRALAQARGCSYLDTDDYYWQATSIPFEVKRPIAERLRLLQRDLDANLCCVLGGSLCGWGDPLIPYFDAVVFVSLDPAVRMERIQQREISRFGNEAVSEGGKHYSKFTAFMEFCASYDTVPAHAPGRGLAKHIAWLANLSCPVIACDSSRPVESLVEEIIARMDGQ